MSNDTEASNWRLQDEEDRSTDSDTRKLCQAKRNQTFKILESEPVFANPYVRACVEDQKKLDSIVSKQRDNAHLTYHAARKMFPDYELGKAQRRRCPIIAPLGGKARAHYTYVEVTSAFAEFKKRNQKQSTSAWDAANALIRKNQPLDKYKNVSGLWNLIKRITKAESLSTDDWYNNL